RLDLDGESVESKALWAALLAFIGATAFGGTARACCGSDDEEVVRRERMAAPVLRRRSPFRATTSRGQPAMRASKPKRMQATTQPCPRGCRDRECPPRSRSKAGEDRNRGPTMVCKSESRSLAM